MAVGRGPVVPRRRLGADLRRLRETAHLKIDEVAAELECSMSKISRLETGKAIPKGRDVRDLLALYGVTDQAHRDRLMRWTREGQQQGWWSEYSDLLPADFDTYISFETDASILHSYDITSFHGLLQTPDYARAVIRATYPHFGPTEVERLAEVRLQRQKRLDSDVDRLELFAVVDESVLWRAIGGHGVMREQLAHLLALLTDRDNVAVRVLDFEVGAHAALNGSFVLVSFPDDEDQDVVYAENAAGRTHLEQVADVKRFRDIVNEVRSRALGAKASRGLIERAIRDHHG